MAFQTIGYESDDGKIYNLKISQEKVAAAGGSAGATTSDMYVKLSKTDREFGKRPRFVTLSQSETTTSGRTLKTYSRLPVTTQAAWAAMSNGQDITIDGETYEVSGKEPEDN